MPELPVVIPTYNERGNVPLMYDCLSLGEYIGRIYEEVKHRPRYIVESQVGFEERAPRRDRAWPNSRP